MANNHVKLKDYQQNAVNFMKHNRGLILYHSTGSGKTITSLMCVHQHPDKVIIIGSKSSNKSFNDDIKKLKLDPTKFIFFTFAKIKKILKNTNTQNFDLFENKSIIVDEAHNLRNETTDNLLIINAIELSKRIILLTATPIINYITDLSVLVNIVKNEQILPTNLKTFNACYYDDINGVLTNKDLLKKKLSNCISYYNKNDEKKTLSEYPKHVTKYISVEMNDQQLEEYRSYIKKYFYDQPYGSGIYGVEFENVNQQKKNFFLASTRQLSNTIGGSSEYPKIRAIYDKLKQNMQNGLSPSIVYSNYLKNGVHALIPLIEKDGIRYSTITGETTNDQINNIVNNYNKGKYDILFLTSAGSESLDLKNTRQIHIMEPHWNESKIEQVIGRAIRYQSHISLPENDRNVKIYRWLSKFPKYVNNKSADEYLIEVSIRKDRVAKQFDEIIKQVSISTKQHGGNQNNDIHNRKNNSQKMLNLYFINKQKWLHLKYQ